MVINGPMVWLQTNNTCGDIRNYFSTLMQLVEDNSLTERFAQTGEALYHSKTKCL